MRIGLLGGSFNPPHGGHLYISLQAQKKLNLRQIWWLPTKQNPLKAIANSQLSMISKLAACEEISKNYTQILVKDLESEIKSVYTVDLLKRVTKKYPNRQFFWIMGADSILQFHHWQNWQEIIKLVNLVVCDRDDFFHQAVRSKAFLLAKKLGRIEFLKIKKMPISSTTIRNQNV